MLKLFKKNGSGVCFFKVVIWILVFIYGVSTHFLPVSFAFTVSPSPSETRLLFQNLESLKIPSHIGRIQEFHLGTKNKIVVLIQDAHAIADAQRNIHQLITFFQEKYGIKIVALEGASDQYDAHFFKSFPDQKFLQNAFEQIHEKGELSGGSAAALFNDTSAFYHGVEDWGLYQEGIDYFHQAVGIESKSLKEIDALEKRLLKQKKVHYTSELLQVDRLLSDFKSDIYNFSAVLAELSKFSTPEEGSELELILKESRSNQLNASVDAEVREIANLVKGVLSSNDMPRRAKTDLYEFNRKHQAFQTSSITAQSFALYLRDLVVKYKLKVKVSKELNYLVSNQRKMRDIKGTALFRQFETYAEGIMRGLISTKDQQSLHEQTKLLNIFKRLAKLELGQEDWEKLKVLANHEAVSFSPSDGVIAYGETTRLLNLMQPNIRFYDIAERRDEIFYDRTTDLMQKRNDSAAIIVAGGFHTEGLTREFKDKGVSYLLLMPAIGSIPESTHYREHMAGQVSWSDYFEVIDGQVSFYEAFLRFTRDLLIEKSKMDQGKLIKEWRDEIIRRLSDQNRIAEAHHYTRYLDELAEKANLGKKDLKNKWLENIELFEKGISSLRDQGLLNEKGVRALLTSMTSQSAPIANGLAPNARSEVRFVPYLKNLLGFSAAESKVRVRAQYENDSEAAEKNASKIPSLLRYGPVSFNEAVELKLTEPERGFDSQIVDDSPETSIHSKVSVVAKTIVNPTQAPQLEAPNETIQNMLVEYETFQETYQDFETGEQTTVDYFEHAASELLIGETDRSPLLILAEHGAPGFSHELQELAKLYGEQLARTEMERRLNQGILVLMSTDGAQAIESDQVEDWAKNKQEPFAGTDWRAKTVIFNNRIPDNVDVEAVFVPENLYEQVTAGLTQEEKQKVVIVRGQVKLNDVGVGIIDGGPRARFSPADIAGGEAIRAPNWQKAVADFMRQREASSTDPTRTYALYGSRTLTSNAKTLPRSEIRAIDAIRRFVQSDSVDVESEPMFESGFEMLQDKRVRRALSRYIDNMDNYLELFDFLISDESSLSKPGKMFIRKMVYEQGELSQLKKEIVSKVKKEKVTFERLRHLLRYIARTVRAISMADALDDGDFEIELEIQENLEEYFTKKKGLGQEEDFVKAFNTHNKLMSLFDEIYLQLVPDSVEVYRSVPRPYIGRPGSYQERTKLQRSDFGVGTNGLAVAQKYANEKWDAIIRSDFGALRKTGGIIIQDSIAQDEGSISLVYQGEANDLEHRIVRAPRVESEQAGAIEQPLSGASAESFQQVLTEKSEQGALLGEDAIRAFAEALSVDISISESDRNNAVRAYIKAIDEFFKGVGFSDEIKNTVVGEPGSYSLQEHTEMVLGQFIDHRLDAFREMVKTYNPPSWFDENFFMLFLSLHDIGKTFAFKDGEIDLQYGNSQKIVDALFDALELPLGAKTLALSLLNQDPLGEYFRESMTAKSKEDLDYFVDHTVKAIDQAAGRLDLFGISREAYFEILAAYYQSDASSYTENARTVDSWISPGNKQGVRSLDELFDFNKTDKLQTIFSSKSRAEEEEVFSMEARFQSLREVFYGRSEMRERAKEEQVQSDLATYEEDVLNRELERAFLQHPEFRDIHNRLKADENLFYTKNDLGWMQNHVRRVVILASSVWRQAVQVDPQLEGMLNDVNLLIIAADLHDVGKTDIPVKILTKPARLEPKERKVMEDHVLAGINKIAVSVNKQNEEASRSDDVISDEKFSRLANIIQFHHPAYPFSERFIQESKDDPLLGVLPLIDAFEAMTGVRGYSKGMNPFKALELLSKDVDEGVLDLKFFNALVQVLGSSEEPGEITKNLFPELSGGRSETREWAVVRSIVLDSIGQFNETLRYLKSEESKVDFLFSYVLPSNEQFLRLDSSSDRRNFTRHKGVFNVENSVKWALAWQSRLNLFYLYQDSSDKDAFMRRLQEKAQSLDPEMNGGKPLYDFFVKDFQSYSWMELHRRVELKELENLVEFGVALNTAGNISYKDAGDYPASAAARETSLNEKEGTSYDAILAYKQPSFRFEERSYAGVGMPHEGWETMPEGYEHDRITRNKSYEKGDLSSMSADAIDIDASIEMSKAASEAGFIDKSTLKQTLDLLEKLRSQRTERGVDAERSEMRNEKAPQALLTLTELREIGDRTVEALRPGSERALNNRDVQNVIQLTPGEFNRFVQIMRETVDRKLEDLSAADASAVLSTQLKVVQALLSTVGDDARGPEQDLSLAINFTQAVDHSSFFNQLFRAIKESGAQGEIFSNAESHRELARTLEPALRSLINLRKLKDSDFKIGGIIGSGDISHGIALALDGQSAFSELNELFLGLVFSDSRANLSEDEQFANEALFAAFLIKTADILRNDEYQVILEDRLRAAETAEERVEIRAEYLKGVLIAELTKVLGATYPNLENAIQSGSGRLTFDGGLIAGIIATYRGEIEASMSA